MEGFFLARYWDWETAPYSGVWSWGIAPPRGGDIYIERWKKKQRQPCGSGLGDVPLH